MNGHDTPLKAEIGTGLDIGQKWRSWASIFLTVSILFSRGLRGMSKCGSRL